MDTTERNTGKVSPSTETNEVFSATNNNENTIGDEIMMDTTERGMASPCEKMEADFILDWSNKLPKRTDSGEGKKKYKMFMVTLCGIAMRMIVTDEEKAKNPETAGRALWFCLKDACEGIDSTNPSNQLRLISDTEKDSRRFFNHEIIFDDFRHINSICLNNKGQNFVSMTGLFQIISKTELDSVTVKEFQKELYERVLPSLALTGKAERPFGSSQSNGLFLHSLLSSADLVSSFFPTSAFSTVSFLSSTSTSILPARAKNPA